MVPLDPKAKALLTAIAAAGEIPIGGVRLKEARELVEKRYARMRIPVKAIKAVDEIIIPGPHGNLALRVYSPQGSGPHPAMVFLHGGGWVFFRPSDYDGICTHLCEAAEVVIFSVDYHRAPRYRFPVALDESVYAIQWVAEHGMKQFRASGKLFISGDSAGGNLAASAALRIRDEGGPRLGGQVLIYPVTDYFNPERESYRTFAEGYGLTSTDMQWFWNKYLSRPSDASNPYATPLRAKTLQGLPPTLVLLSGYDPLHDEGMDYFQRLKDEGNQVTLKVHGDMIHGFLSYLGILPQASSAINDIASWTNSTN
jgi:acetyl esterase